MVLVGCDGTNLGTVVGSDGCGVTPAGAIEKTPSVLLIATEMLVSAFEPHLGHMDRLDVAMQSKTCIRPTLCASGRRAVAARAAVYPAIVLHKRCVWRELIDS